MHLYHPETQQMLSTSESVCYTDMLQTVWNDMMAAGVPAVEAACFMAEHGSIFRCEVIMTQMVKKSLDRKEALHRQPYLPGLHMLR